MSDRIIAMPEPFGYLHDGNGSAPLTFERGSIPLERALLCSTVEVFTASQMREYARSSQQAERQREPDEPDWRHPKIQALIGADARHRICIGLVWRILEDPRGDFTASDMEYWDKLHDKVQAVALAAALAQKGGAA